MAWIESHQELARHPKTARMARYLRIEVPHAVGHLHCLWWWAMDFATDGDLSGFDPMDIAAGAMWTGDETEFIEGLRFAGFLDTEPLRLHDWDDYGGKLHRKRAANAERMKAAREAKNETRATAKPKRATNVQRTSASVQRTCSVRGQDIDSDRDRTVETAAHAGASAPPPNQPYALFQALCDETGADESAASAGFKSQQLGIAKRLLQDGYTDGDVRDCVRYLKSQTWRTGIIDLRTVQAEIGKWAISGRPAAEPIPIRPGIATRGGGNYDQFVGELDAMLRGGQA